LKELIFQISEILIDNEYKLTVDGISISTLSSLFYKSFAPDLGYRSFDASMENFLNSADVAKNLKGALLVRIKNEMNRRGKERVGDSALFSRIIESSSKVLSDRNAEKIKKEEKRLNRAITTYFFDDAAGEEE
jgi:hypothetical protein